MKRFVFVIVTLFLIIFLNFCIRNGYGVLLPQMLGPLSMTKTEAGVIFAAFFATNTVTAPLMGMIADRYSIRVELTICVAVLSAGAFLMAIAGNLLQASLFYALTGIGSAACWSPVMALAQRWAADKRRGATLALIDLGGAAGIIVTGTFLPVIITGRTWHSGWLVLGFLGVVITIFTFFIIRDAPQTPAIQSPGNRQEQFRQVLPRLFRDGRFHLLGIAYLFTCASITIGTGFLTTFAVQNRGFSYETAALLMTVVGACSIPGKLVWGTLSDRFHRTYVLAFCTMLNVVSFAAIAFGSQLVIIIGTVVFGFSYAALFIIYAALSADLFSRKYTGSVMGMWTVYSGAGTISAPIFAGWLGDTTGSMSWSFLAAGVAALLAMTLQLVADKIPAKMPTAANN